MDLAVRLNFSVSAPARRSPATLESDPLALQTSGMFAPLCCLTWSEKAATALIAEGSEPAAYRFRALLSRCWRSLAAAAGIAETLAERADWSASNLDPITVFVGRTSATIRNSDMSLVVPPARTLPISREVVMS